MTSSTRRQLLVGGATATAALGASTARALASSMVPPENHVADRIGRVHAAVAELRAALEAAYPGADVKGVSHIETVECLLADCGHTVTWNGQKFCKPGQMTVVNFSALYSREHATMDDLLAATEDKL